EIYGECDLVPANRARKFNFVGMRLRAGNPVRRFLPRILKADLDMIQTSIYQRLEALLIEPDPRRDQVGVKSRGAGSSDQLCQIRTGQRFATRKVRVQHSQPARLREHANPLLGRELRSSCRELHGIRAVHAMQGTAVSNFGNECERAWQVSNPRCVGAAVAPGTW